MKVNEKLENLIVKAVNRTFTVESVFTKEEIIEEYKEQIEDNDYESMMEFLKDEDLEMYNEINEWIEN